jgi:hypothetical protein
LLLGAVVLHELEQAVALLKLNLVLRHDATSTGSVRTYMLYSHTA